MYVVARINLKGMNQCDYFSTAQIVEKRVRFSKFSYTFSRFPS